MNHKSYHTILYYSDYLRATDSVQAVHSRDFLRAMLKYSKFRVVGFPPIDLKEGGKSGWRKTNRPKLTVLPLFHSFYHTFVLHREWNGLQRYISAIRPDIIIARHNGLFLNIIKKIAELSTPLLLEVNSLISYDCELAGHTIDPVMEEMEKYVLTKAAKILIVSEGYRKLIAEKGVDTKKIFVLPNAADQDLFYLRQDKRQPQDEGKVILVYIGNIYKGRDIETLIEGFNIARKEVNCLKLIIAGKGDFRSPDPEHIEYLGFIEHQAIPDIIQRADITLAIYKRQFIKDGSPLKVFEYMSMAKPVIVTGGGQVDPILESNRAGLICEPEVPESLAKAIITLARDEDLRKEMGRNARKVILENHTYKKNVEKIDAICQEALSK